MGFLFLFDGMKTFSLSDFPIHGVLNGFSTNRQPLQTRPISKRRIFNALQHLFSKHPLIKYQRSAWPKFLAFTFCYF